MQQRAGIADRNEAIEGIKQMHCRQTQHEKGQAQNTERLPTPWRHPPPLLLVLRDYIQETTLRVPRTPLGLNGSSPDTSSHEPKPQLVQPLKRFNEIEVGPISIRRLCPARPEDLSCCSRPWPNEIIGRKTVALLSP